MERPKNLDSSFDDVIRDAETSKLSAEQKKSYMEARKLSEHERLVVYEGGYEMGMLDGAQKRNAEIARNLLADGIPAEQVARWTGLSEEEIAKLTRYPD